ncbi:hypothetical protein EV174_004467 [Coemansia sp. RSA 2320]|nr:hypothetical protein EV174_004467 [Coemansia sp. RSA 2320]
MFRSLYRGQRGLAKTGSSKRAFVTTSARVNQSIARLVSLVLRDFVQEWYEKVTDDREFLNEVTVQIMLVVNELEKRCRQVDWVQFILFELPDIIHLHVKDSHQCMARLGTVYVGGETSLEAIFQSMQPHVALTMAADSELAYLRRLASELLQVILPPEAHNDEVVIHLLREILACAVLRNAIDAAADPNTLNEGIIRAVGKHSKKEYFNSADMSRYVTLPIGVDCEPGQLGAGGIDGAGEPGSPTHSAGMPVISVENMLREAQTTQLGADGAEARSVLERLSSQLSFGSRWLISDLFSQARWRGWKNNTIRGLVYLHLIIVQAVSRVFSVFSEYTFSLNQLWQPDTMQASYRGAIEPTLALANALLLFDRYNQWAWVQFIFYLFPLINILAGPAIDRTLAKVVGFLLCEQQVASYVDMLVDNLWKPEDGGKFKTKDRPYKTLDQELMLRNDAAELVAELLPYIATKFFYGPSEQERLVAAQRILEPFENRQLNKHMVYTILDAVVGKLAPELKESKPTH